MIDPKKTVLVVIDIQDKLYAVMDGKEALLDATRRLIEGIQVLGIPVVVTEQYPKGLGGTVPEIMQMLPDVTPIEKMSFSCCGSTEFESTVKKLGRKHVLIAGIETHVCVYQTVHDMLTEAYDVRVVGDCVSSRSAENRRIALDLIRDIGGYVTSMETALLELLGTADHPKFKDISRIVR